MPDKRICAPATDAPAKKGFPLKWVIIGCVVFLSVAIIVALAATLGGSVSGGKVALIKVSGPVGGGGGLLERQTSSDDIVGMIRRAEDDSRVKGILLQINSPGGSPVASEEIMKAVRDAEKPTVALIRDVGASGAYWVATGADHIVASPVSLTGSVGVTAAYLEFSGFMEQYGIGYERIVSGKYKDIGSPFRNLTEEERAILMEDLSAVHQYFLDSVTENRQITDNESIAQIATARVFLGSEALRLGLVDELGGKKEAEEWLMGKTGLDEIKYVSYEKKSLFNLGPSLAEQSSVAGSAFGKSLVASVFEPKSSVTT